MSKQIIFCDDVSDNKLRAFINSEKRLFIEAGDLDDEYNNGYLTLNKDDVTELITYLTELKEQM